ncbi:MAG: hypothetical protein JNM14_03795 [Ferruginibacter sp.]|nr:hypothetical protein [Ferruginibacter sp.]
MKLFRYINISLTVYREIRKQKQYNKTFLIPYLQQLENKYGGKFSDEQKKKVLNYYGLFITSFLCSSYTRLRGRTLTDAERKRATLFGILTPVGDDLFDEDKLDIESIRTITHNPQDYAPTTFSAKVAKEIQSFLLNDVPHKKEYLQAAKNVLDIQIQTARQTDPAISIGELEHITYTKGAVSVIIYHQCLDEAADEQMKQALFCIGSLYQLGNDIFDLYKDVRDNIYTLVNTCDDFAKLRTQFLARVRLQNQKIRRLPFPKREKKDFCFVMNTINARSLVALDQLVKMQKKAGGKINWWQLQRKDMIVDMEKPRNFLKWLIYAYKLPG